ncbi:hypothetical protein PV327_011534 [Microctonus hyperodae]|uniref:PiggyBac transposable element-derived protein domain-containing protein n=1 Tax=Microctonus hyperodae TaxID=165561 RepID=A0AA39KQ12_MICHY|nr:hypothetical protein PV327_011534 [Microctonus hyperodae]
MGGVDLHDNGVANYRISIRGKKWWWPLWIQCLDSAVVNAWKLHCLVTASKNAKPMSQLHFKNTVAKSLLLASEDVMAETDSTTTDETDADYMVQNLPKLDRLHVSIKVNNRRRCIVCAPKATIFNNNRNTNPKLAPE